MKKDQTQANFLDELIEALNLKNDAALSRALGVAPPVISKIRNNRLPVGAALLIKIHEATGWSFAEMREMLGEQEKKAA